jgi:hypothetical protein
VEDYHERTYSLAAKITDPTKREKIINPQGALTRDHGLMKSAGRRRGLDRQAAKSAKFSEQRKTFLPLSFLAAWRFKKMIRPG